MSPPSGSLPGLFIFQAGWTELSLLPQHPVHSWAHFSMPVTGLCLPLGVGDVLVIPAPLGQSRAHWKPTETWGKPPLSLGLCQHFASLYTLPHFDLVTVWGDHYYYYFTDKETLVSQGLSTLPQITHLTLAEIVFESRKSISRAHMCHQYLIQQRKWKNE